MFEQVRAWALVKPLFDVLEGVFEVDLWALELQVDQTVPDLPRLVERQLALAHPAVGVVRRVPEHIVFPKDRVLDEVLVGEGPHSAAVLIRTEFEDVPLNLYVDVVVEKAVTAEIPAHQDF